MPDGVPARDHLGVDVRLQPVDLVDLLEAGRAISSTVLEGAFAVKPVGLWNAAPLRELSLSTNARRDFEPYTRCSDSVFEARDCTHSNFRGPHGSGSASRPDCFNPAHNHRYVW